MSRHVLAVFAVLALTLPAAGQAFNYPDFSSLSGLTLNGNAAQQSIRLRVTPAMASQIGSVYRNSMVSVVNGFDTTFTFRMANPGGGGADGMAFVVHNDPRGDTAIGADGSEMGYGANATSPANTAVTNALVVEIDTWQSALTSPAPDLSGNEISVHTNGMLGCTSDELFSIGRTSPVTNMSDGLLHTMRILYLPGTLMVFLDNAPAPELTLPFDFAAGGTYVVSGTAAAPPMLAAGGMAWVGFSAATGAAFETHDLGSWSFATLSPPTYPGNASDFGCQVTVNGVLDTNSTRVIPVNALDIIGLHYHSPLGGTDGQYFSALYQLVAGGTPLVSAVVPGETPPGGFWLDVGGTNPGALTAIVPFIDGLGLGGPSLLMPLLLPGGYDHGFVLPALLSGLGTSLLIQAVIADPGLNGLNLGIDDCIELQVN